MSVSKTKHLSTDADSSVSKIREEEHGLKKNVKFNKAVCQTTLDTLGLIDICGVLSKNFKG